jgi:diacylglycerol kinase family enzyme
VQQKSRTVVAGGGDGTVSTVAAALVGTSITLGVLPLGTLNHFAHDLHIPIDVEAAALNIVTGRVAAVDVAEVNGRIFVNNSSLGIYPRIVRERVQKQKLGWSKWIAFAQALVWVLWQHSRLHVRLEVNDKELVRDTPFVFVGNNDYRMEGLKIGVRARLDAGHLCVYTAQRVGRAGLVRLAFLALMGRLQEAEELDVLRPKKIWIKTRRRRIQVALDGEVNLMATPLHYRTLPGALRVIVPTAAAGEAAG